MGVTDVRIVVDEVRITDPNDPMLDGETATLVLRALVDDQLIAETTVDNLKVPDLEARGGVLVLNEELARITVWRGSELAVEVSPAVGRPPQAEVILTGDPRDWRGSHLSARAAVGEWRLKISVHSVPRAPQRRERTAT